MMYPMEKRFLASGLESGMRLSRPASGNEIRKEKMSLTRRRRSGRCYLHDRAAFSLTFIGRSTEI